MTPLRQRFFNDMQLRGLAPTTQRSYLHYASEFANFYHTSPDKLDLEAVRQYELYLLHEKKLSPESINTFVSAVQFLFLTTLEMPWGKESFPRVRRPDKTPRHDASCDNPEAGTAAPAVRRRTVGMVHDWLCRRAIHPKILRAVDS
jgi:hypothetical protein